MKILSRLALAVYLSVILCFTLNLFFGPCGLLEYRKLNRVKNTLISHVGKLEQLNRDLRSDLVLIQEDQREIQLRARKLGYYQDNEGVIIVEGGRTEHGSSFPGYLLSSRHEPVNNSSLLVLFSLIFGALFFVSSFIIRSPKHGYQKRRTGMPAAGRTVPESRHAGYRTV